MRGRVADCLAVTGCGGCAMQSTTPAAHRGTPSCLQVPIARAPSLMRMRARLVGWLGQAGQQHHVASLVHAGSWAVGLIEGV
jgi:hypothetical protein